MPTCIVKEISKLNFINEYFSNAQGCQVGCYYNPIIMTYSQQKPTFIHVWGTRIVAYGNTMKTKRNYEIRNVNNNAIENEYVKRTLQKGKW